MDYITVCSFINTENGTRLEEYITSVKESLNSQRQEEHWRLSDPTSAPAGCPGVLGWSFLSGWEVVLNPPDEPHPDFCHTASFQGVLDKFGLHSHLDLEGQCENEGSCLPWPL